MKKHLAILIISSVFIVVLSGCSEFSFNSSSECESLCVAVNGTFSKISEESDKVCDVGPFIFDAGGTNKQNELSSQFCTILTDSCNTVNGARCATT